MRRRCRTLRLTLVGFGIALSAAARGSALAAGPARVAMLVDTSQATAGAMNFVRSAVGALIAGLPDDTELLLATTGRRVQVRLAPTTDRQKALASAKGLTSDGGPTVLMDALLELDDRFMRKSVDRTAVFVILTGDGSESSKTDGDQFNTWLKTLPGRGLAAHAVILKNGNGVPEVVAHALCQATQGRCEAVGNGGLLAEKMASLAAWLTVR
jgi:VWA domain-containing protein